MFDPEAPAFTSSVFCFFGGGKVTFGCLLFYWLIQDLDRNNMVCHSWHLCTTLSSCAFGREAPVPFLPACSRENKKEIYRFWGIFWFPGRPIKEQVQQQHQGLTWGASGSRRSVCSRRLEGAGDAPTLTPDFTLSSVQLSLSLFCPVVATISLLLFAL